MRWKSIIYLFFSLQIVNSTFEDIVSWSETVYEQETISSEFLNNTVNGIVKTLERDIDKRDEHLRLSLVEVSGILENFIFRIEHEGIRKENRRRVRDFGVYGRALTNLVVLMLKGIKEETCSSSSNQNDCSIDIDSSAVMINETEERLLRILDLALGWNIEIASVSFELADIIATAVTGEARELQILLNEISDTFKLDDVQTNLTMYDGQLLKLYTYSFKTNFYVFAKNSAFSNSGVTKAFIHDGNSRMVNLFSNNDDLSFVVDASVPLSDPNYWQNLTGFKENELNVFNISLGSNALLTIDFMFLAPCVTHLMRQTDVLLRVLTTKENESLSVVKNMTNTTIRFQNQQLEITFVGKPQRNSTDDYTVSIQCEECIGVADIVILFQISKDYDSLKKDAKKLLVYIHRRYTAARIAMMTFGVNTTIISHFTYSAQVSKIDSMSFKPPYWSESNIDLALNDMVDYFETYGHNNSRRINIIYTDGLYSSMSNAQYNSTMRRMRSINLKTLILISNEKTHDTDEMKRWSDYPRRNFIWPASDVPQYIFDKMCKGNKNKDKIFNSYRFGHIIPYSLNEKAWDQSTNIQLKTIADNKITFKCNYLGTFSCNVFYIPPQTINFEKIIMNFNEKLAGSPYVLVTNITLLIIAVISVLVLRRFDIIDQKRWTYFPLYDNPKSASYSYFISIHTGIWSDRKLSSIPFFVLKGINGKTGTRALFDGNRENFNRLTYSNFLLKTNTSLGDLKEIKLWQSGRNASWHVEKILVFDGQKIYVFLCGEWLSTSKGDGKCYRKLYASKKDLNENNSLIHVISESKLFDDHLLLSLFSRPSFSRFSRVQRLICIFSILSMSMLCSAMWFQTDKGTKVLGISIGPIVINYKQFYVGLMSAVLTFPLSCLLSHLFRKRKFKGEQEDAVLRKLNKGYLPWWTLIIGYVISCFIILSGFTMTFFYSLEWENDISINWLMSFLFGTVEDIVFLNPSKVVLGSILIVCLCNSHAEEHVKEMALTSALIHNNKNVRHRTYMKDLPLSEWTGNHINRKGKMSANRGLLNRRLLEVFSKIARQLCYVILVLIICTHNDVEKSYLQNENIRNQLSPISKVNNTLDIWNYLSHQFIHKIFPKRLSGADVRLVYDRGFMDDDCSYKIGLIQLRQMRVNGKCTVPKIMSKTVDFCYMSYDTKDARETMHFCPEWKPYTEACYSDGFKFYDDFATGSACFVGRFATYDGGGYLKVLDPTKSEIQNDILKLKTNNWINEKTRLVVAEGVVLNINTKLFTSFRIMFELPPWGNVEASLEVKTTQLYPYISTSDFLVLGLQILFILMTFFRILFLIFAIFKDNNRSRHISGHLVELMSVGLCITAIVCYIIRIDNTISSIEAIYNTKEVFVSFEDVNKFDTLYRIIMSTEMFIAIVRLLQPLNLNFHLFVMQNAISSHKNEILSFGIMVCILMTSFAAFMYLYGDWTLYKFRSVLASYLTLLQAFLSMVRFKEAFHTTDLVLESMFTFFLFCSSVLIINMFISMLNDGFKTVKHSNHTNGVTKFDKELNEHFWWKMENFQKIFSSMNETKTERKRKYITDENDITINSMKLDNQAYVICETVIRAQEEERNFDKVTLSALMR